MGLMDWRSSRNQGPLSKILIGLLLVIISCLLVWKYISSIIAGELGIFLIILFGLLLLFYFLLMFFGGINEIREGIDIIKKGREK